MKWAITGRWFFNYGFHVVKITNWALNVNKALSSLLVLGKRSYIFNPKTQQQNGCEFESEHFSKKNSRRWQNSLIFKSYFILCEYLFSCMYVCTSCSCLVPAEVSRGYWRSWNWNYEGLWDVTWVLETEPSPSARVTSYWVISSASPPPPLGLRQGITIS